MIGWIVLAAFAGALLGLSIGVALERRARGRLAQEAGREALAALRYAQERADLDRLAGRKPLPPMVAREEALARAAADGISVEEAAGAIFASRAAALVRDNVRTHRRSHL